MSAIEICEINIFQIVFQIGTPLFIAFVASRDLKSVVCKYVGMTYNNGNGVIQSTVYTRQGITKRGRNN